MSMTKQQTELAKKMIESSPLFKLNQVAYEVTKDDKNFGIEAWTPNANAFHATDLIPILQHYFSCYVYYNQEKKRCQLSIF